MSKAIKFKLNNILLGLLFINILVQVGHLMHFFSFITNSQMLSYSWSNVFYNCTFLILIFIIRR